MKTWARKLTILLLLLFPATKSVQASTYYDKENIDLYTFFVHKNATYIIRHSHTQKGSITLPPNTTIDFQGGSISADLTFNNTQLKGLVNLKGSKINGTLKNEVFNAKWLCHADGKSDDAANINAILQICNKVWFPKGVYLMASFHKPKYKINKPYHIGINRSNIKLLGEKGATITTKSRAGTLCLYSKPYDIPNSVHDIEIRGLTFTVQNEKTKWDPEQEHCHTISLIGANRVVIQDNKIHNFWGDAICLNHYGDNEKTGERTRNMNVKIYNNYIDGYKLCNRNGISVINGANILIENNKIVNTTHPNMPGAIDIEANNTAYTVENISIINNKIDNSQGANAAIGVIANKRGGPAHNIKIVRNRITNSRRAFEFAINQDYTASCITVTDNWVDANTEPWIWHGEGRTKSWTFSNNTFLHKKTMRFGRGVRFEGLNYKNNKIK